MKRNGKRLLCLMAGLLLLCGCTPRVSPAPEPEMKSALVLPRIKPIKPMGDLLEKPWTLPEPNAEPEPNEEPEPEAPAEEEPEKPRAPYYVKVNCEMNTVTIYTLDENRQYTVPCRAMVCSSGIGGSTPLGIYTPTGNRWSWLGLVEGVKGMYATQIFGDYLFHSVPYTEWYDHGSLQPGEFDKLGEAASHGCIRLQVEDAKWIYDHVGDIEAVELYNSPDPGPLGKPTAPKIGESAYPGWDPTDRDENNPWLAPPQPDPEPIVPQPEPQPEPEPEPPAGPETSPETPKYGRPNI